MSKVLVALAVVVCGCMTPVMTFGEGKTAVQAQHDTISDFLPAPLAFDKEWQGEVRDVKIRVYADADFRAQNLKWQQAFEQQLDYANAVLVSHFGIRMRPEYKTWDRQAAGVKLDESLAVLMRLDPGHDVFAVVGLTSSLALVEATFELLGVATLGGRHMILRGYANIEERNAFAAAFPDLSSDERENAHERRRRHKTTAVMLHEIGHNLGVEHEVEDKTLMSGHYSHLAADFSAQASATMLRAVDQRLGRAPSPGSEHAGPVASEAPTTRAPPILVRIDESGRPFVGSEAVEMGDLSSKLAIHKGAELVIQKHRKAPSEAVAKVIDAAKESGLEKFTITVY